LPATKSFLLKYEFKSHVFLYAPSDDEDKERERVTEGEKSGYMDPAMVSIEQ